MSDRSIVPEYPAKSGGHVLIIEKDPLQGYLLKMSLQDTGWIVYLVEEPREGLRCCENKVFDAAIINSNYPEGVDGFVLAKRLWESQYLPCLMITATRYAELERRTSFSEKQELIFKPYQSMECEKKLKVLLEQA